MFALERTDDDDDRCKRGRPECERPQGAGRAVECLAVRGSKELVDRFDGKPTDECIFETGYGPSGLPHIGTFNEVRARPWCATPSSAERTDPTRLIAFSDDMDGLRKVPDNVPNREMLAAHLGKPLTRSARSVRQRIELRRITTMRAARIPRPLRLRIRIRVVDRLLQVRPLRRDAAESARATTTRSWRSCCRRCARSGAQTYSPVLPISPTSGVVLQVPVEVLDAEPGTIGYRGSRSGERIDSR